MLSTWLFFLVICYMSQDALIMSLQRFPVVPFQITNFAVLKSDQLQHAWLPTCPSGSTGIPEL